MNPVVDEEAAPAGRRADRGTDWVTRNGWLVTGVWLVFLVFPVLTILGADDIDDTRKVASIALITVFGLVYVHGFRVQHDTEVEAGRQGLAPEAAWPDGRLHFALLVALNVVVYLLVDVPSLGLVPFLVSFAAFHFSWPVLWAVAAGSVGGTFGLLIAEDALADVWFLGLIVVSVTAGMMFIRVLDGFQAAQAQLRTNLAISDERSRVARDVHDVLGHSLTAVILKAELASRMLDGVEPATEADRARLGDCREQLGELQSISRSALAEIRSTVGGLRAANLADEVTVARTVLADAGVDLLVTGEVASVPEQHRPMLAWVVRESVTNVVRHAKADHCRIELTPGPVVLRVSDDGVGRGVSADGNGLRGLRERVEAGGAQLRLRSDDGTHVEVLIGDPI